MLTLVANPGTASRKYALYDGEDFRIGLHFEYESGRVVCTITKPTDQQKQDTDLSNISEASDRVMQIIAEHGAKQDDEQIGKIGVRLVAPSALFLHDQIMNDETLSQLENLRSHAPMHIDATLQEIRKLRDDFPEVTIVGVSDSAFHTEKPDFTWNYGLPLYDTDRLEIKRFGYHGISLAAVVRNLRRLEKLSAKLIVCHIGSTVSVTALHESRSVDTTMGFSPLDGLVMATRSGSVDPAAILYLKRSLDLDDSQLELYLNEQSGLQGLSCTSSDIRDLLSYESEDHRAALALQVYVYGIQKAIGQMTAAVGGVDMLVFTGVVGERSAIIRERILKPFHYLDLMLDAKENSECVSPSSVTCISHLAHSRPIYVIPTDEADEIARRANDMS